MVYSYPRSPFTSHLTRSHHVTRTDRPSYRFAELLRPARPDDRSASIRLLVEQSARRHPVAGEGGARRHGAHLLGRAVWIESFRGAQTGSEPALHSEDAGPHRRVGR